VEIFLINNVDNLFLLYKNIYLIHIEINTSYYYIRFIAYRYLFINPYFFWYVVTFIQFNKLKQAIFITISYSTYIYYLNNSFKCTITIY